MTAAAKRSPSAPVIGSRGGTGESGGNEMAAEQDKNPQTGGVPALNIERIYSTTVPAEELARSLEAWPQKKIITIRQDVADVGL